MNDQRSRRALLLGSIGAAAGLIARQLSAIAADDGQFMKVGGTYSSNEPLTLESAEEKPLLVLNNAFGVALKAYGSLKLPSASGVKAVRPGARDLFVEPSVQFTARSLVFASVNGGDTAIQRITLETSHQVILIKLTRAVPVTVHVSWLILG